MKVLCRLEQVPAQGAIGVDEERLIALKWDGRVHLYRNCCPHQGSPLNWLPNDFLCPDGELLQCHTHDARFLPDSGECISGPCLGQRLQPVPFRVRDGKLTIPG